MTREALWKKSWTWPWDDALPRDPKQVFSGLDRMKDRLTRGKVWVARFKGNYSYDGSGEKKRRIPKSLAPHSRRALGRRGRRTKGSGRGSAS